MREALVAFIVGVPVALGVIPLSHRLGLLDRPGPIKPHARPIPYTGGSVIALVLVAVGVFFRLPLAPLLGAAAMWLVGFVDDTKRLPPALKLFAELPALAIGSFAVELSPLERLIGILVGLFLVNVFNVIDGMDGLAGGCAAIALVALLVLGSPLSTVAQITLGVVVAFLIFNIPPARLFLGDEGSLVLGYVLWLVPLAALADAQSIRLLIAYVLTWSFPLVNAVFVIAARLRAGRPVLVGDRRHLYDVLFGQLGLRRSLVICWAVSAAGALMAAALA